MFNFENFQTISISWNRQRFFSAKFAAVAFILVLLAILLWQSSAIVAFFESFSSANTAEYTTISLVSGQYITYQNENSSYLFSFGLYPGDQTNVFYVARDVQQTRGYPATPGAVYYDLGLEIKVSAVSSDLAVLLVKPTS
jgi:hypothetical protein